jgi:hypothetical protein
LPAAHARASAASFALVSALLLSIPSGVVLSLLIASDAESWPSEVVVSAIESGESASVESPTESLAASPTLPKSPASASTSLISVPTDHPSELPQPTNKRLPKLLTTTFRMTSSSQNEPITLNPPGVRSTDVFGADSDLLPIANTVTPPATNTSPATNVTADTPASVIAVFSSEIPVESHLLPAMQ